MINKKKKKKKKLEEKEKSAYRWVDFAVPANDREEIKESEKKDKCLNLARKQRKLRNMRVT